MATKIHHVNIPVPEQFVQEMMEFSARLSGAFNENDTYLGYMIAVSAARDGAERQESMAVSQAAGRPESYVEMASRLIPNTRQLVCNGLMELQRRAGPVPGVVPYSRRTIGSVIDECVRDRIKQDDPDSLPQDDEPDTDSEVEPEPDQEPEPKRDVVYSLVKVGVVVCAIVGAMVIGYTVIAAIVGGAR